MPNNARQWLLIVGALAALVVAKRSIDGRRRNPRGLPLPPGPKGKPIVGNAAQIPKIRPWEGYHALCQEYGDIIYLNALGQGILVLDSRRRAVDLLENRSTIYSDRPKLAATDLADMNWSFGLMPYGREWRRYRRTFHDFFRRTDLGQLHPIMYEERDKFLHSLEENPSNFFESLASHFGVIIMRAAYGFDDVERNRDIIQTTVTLLAEMGEARKPGRYLVNVFPILKYVPGWFPGAGFQQHFKYLAAKSMQVLHRPFEEAKVLLSQDRRSVHPSLAGSLIDRISEEGDPTRRAELEAMAKGVTGIAFMAGADTTVAVAQALFLALANHPAVQKKAREELDAVVGRGRLPLITDRPALPFVHAVVKEVGRWYNSSPIGLARATAEDDEYDGYFIPKGTLVLTNQWAIMHDPETFERPFDFVPERYLKDGKIDPSTPDPEYGSFGFGRRICPGLHFSNDALFSLAASVLSRFTIETPKDEFGFPVQLELKLMSTNVAKPLPFECIITPRH
ncbi:O-methylsterigmatocystin oxidoreductase [Coprinellus micaceus]|uniref:O-methylsterigmatocystin oxidoreductase n=1 Tax=Coprinellus micaceus TaxID=71717 RepID=A0A4Y7T1T3_COPMI|nr:O-methylsterigmatocystin oxidoreductase [Coprinellus micaceus]